MSTSAARIAIATVSAVALASASFGAAASLGGINARDLSTGQANVLTCDGDGVGLTYTTSSGVVQSVTVTDVAAECVNGALRVVLADGSGASIGAGGPVTVSGSSVGVSLSPQPTATAVAAAHISIVGP